MSAFMFAKPIIASNVGAFSEVIKNNYNGLLVEPNSPALLASAIDQLCKNQVEYREMEVNIRNFSANKEYNWSYIAQRTKEVLEK